MSTACTLWLEPLDVLVFRDLRGLEPGEQHDARSALPGPGVLLGALRGALFRQLGADFRSADPHYGLKERWWGWLGSREGPGTLQLRGPLLYRTVGGQREPLFPAPLDQERPDQRTIEELALRPDGLGQTPPVLPWWPAGGTKDAAGARWLCEHGARGWMLGGPRDPCACGGIEERHLLVREVRVGIARGAERTVSTGLYYQQETLRFAPGAGIAVGVDAADAAQLEELGRLDGRAIPLGGRGHRVLVRLTRRALLPKLPLGPGRVRACFVTPLVLADPALGLPGVRHRRRVLGPPELVGGWDLANRRPRPLRRALPAGSVIELDGVETPDALRAHDWGQPSDLARAGYGTALLGGV